jgi:hypothetical protein
MAVLLGLADVLFQLNLVDFLSAFIDSFLHFLQSIQSYNRFKEPHQGTGTVAGDFMSLFS